MTAEGEPRGHDSTGGGQTLERREGRRRTLVGVRIGEHLHTSRDEVVLELASVVLLRVDKLMGEGQAR